MQVQDNVNPHIVRMLEGTISPYRKGFRGPNT